MQDRADAAEYGELIEEFLRVRQLFNKCVALESEHRIPTLFESERRHGLSTQAGAAHGSGEMPGIDIQIVPARSKASRGD
jgi:hypothetical protein